jgi:hypothetical protein
MKEEVNEKAPDKRTAVGAADVIGIENESTGARRRKGGEDILHRRIARIPLPRTVQMS